MSETFDLHRTVRAVLCESDSTDLGVLAGEVMARIPKQSREAALSQALPAVVRGASRLSSVALPVQSTDTPGGQPPNDAHGVGVAGGPSRGSHKSAAIRTWFDRVRRERINVGEDHKFFGECTIVDLEAAAAIREDHARATIAKADQLRAVAKLMADHGADTVADLPEAVLRDAIDGEAA